MPLFTSGGLGLCLVILVLVLVLRIWSFFTSLRALNYNAKFHPDHTSISNFGYVNYSGKSAIYLVPISNEKVIAVIRRKVRAVDFHMIFLLTYLPHPNLSRVPLRSSVVLALRAPLIYLYKFSVLFSANRRFTAITA